MIAIALVSAGCKGLLGIDDDVALVDATVDTAVQDDASAADASFDAPVDAVPVACPNGYAATPNGSSYRIVQQQAEWLNAANDCADDTAGVRTHLVVFGSDAERQGVGGIGTERFWIGLSKRTDVLQWVTEEMAPVPMPTDPAWQQGEPDGIAQPCISVEESLLADEGCANNHPYICECDSFANVPSRY